MGPASTVILLVIVMGVSTALVAVCGMDKRRAKQGRTRVPERVLLGMALLGGSPGLVLGMLWFRHKTRKVSFLFRVFLVVALQGALALWWLGEGPST